jgi:hypothetical protein
MPLCRKLFLVLTLACAATAILFIASPSYGQAVAVAEIHGQVLDTSGSAVPGATVRVTQTETQFTRTTTSDPQGGYILANLPLGAYKLEVTNQGFKTHVQSNILLQVGNNIQINVNLQVGAVTENVEVKAETTMVETKDNAVSQVIDQRRILELPLNGRQATSLVLLAGGSVNAPTSGNDNVGSKSFYSSVVIAVAGSQGNNLNYLLDGGDNNDTFSNVNLPFPFPDALQEFSVETNALPARNGLHPGGAVNIVTKSGTNTLHGDLFEFLRNGSVNARNYFLATHDVLHRNQFGGTLGGRVIKDRLFFFGGYQGTRQVQSVPQAQIVLPTPAALNGDFSVLDKTKQLIDPVNGKPFTGNQIPTTRFDPAAKAFIKYLPVVNDPNGTFTYSIPRTGNDDQFIGRVDFLQSAKNTIFGRYFLEDYSNPAVWDPHNILVTTVTGNLQRAQSFTLGDSFTISPATVNSFHATFTRRRNDRSSAPQLIGPSDLGITGANLSTYIPNYLQIQITGGTSIVGCSTCTPAKFNVNTFQFADDIDIIRGRHQIAFGVDLIRTQNNTNAGYKENGSFFFGTNSALSSGDGLADLLIGALSEYDQSRPQQTAYRQTIPGFYAQDTIKWSSRFTLNIGLRWEPMLYATDLAERGTTFSMSDFLAGNHSKIYPNGPAGMFYYGDAGVPKAFTNNKWANFSPRVGMVWNPHGDGRDTIRAGIGVLYNTPEAWFFQRLASNPPVVNEIDLTGTQVGTFSAPWSNYPGGNPFPGAVPAPHNVTFPTSTLWVVLPPNMKPTAMTEWNVTYQKQLAGDWMVSGSYIGNKTSHLWLGYDLNAATPVAGIPISDITHRRPLYIARPADGALIGNLLEVDDGANANYNGMLLSLQHRFSHGFTLLSNYTWSHCISDGDSVGNIRQGYYQIQTNRRADRGNCNYDVTHIFNSSFVYLTPTLGKGIAGKILGNWQFAPILRATSGIAINVSSGADNSGSGNSSLLITDRPNQMLPDIYTHSWGAGTPQYINPAAFAANPAGTFGNVGRDTARAPGQLNLDMAFSRIFSFTERFQLEARGEAFNAINHTNFTTVETRQNNKNFGKITAAGDPRILQFALKLRF